MKENSPDDRAGFLRAPKPLSMVLGSAMMQYGYPAAGSGQPPEKLARIIDGIKKYQEHPYERAMEPLPEIWRRGEVSLQHCPAADKNAPVLLLIPSMINRSTIFDLMPERSFVRWLAAEGIHVVLLDWGDPVKDPSLESIDRAMSDRLSEAALFLSQQYQVVFALGYCMGGTFLTAFAQSHPDLFRGLIFLATPWDFDADSSHLSFCVRHSTPSALAMIEKKNMVSDLWIQTVLAAANAKQAAEKFASFSRLDQDSAKAQHFVAVEDWLNQGVNLPGGVAKTCLLDWYRDNKPGRGRWSVGGQIVSPAHIQTPGLVIASANDRLVAASSAAALYRRLPHASLLQPESGHVGMITGSRAVEEVWRPIRDWIKKS